MGLTQAETVCAIYAAMGHSQKRIAYELGVTEATVSLHVRRAVEKLGLRSRASLAHVFGAGAPSSPDLRPPEKSVRVPGNEPHPGKRLGPMNARGRGGQCELECRPGAFLGA